MKRVVTVILMMLILGGVAYAKPINSNVYKTMSAPAYRSNYNRQVNNAPMPYWQAQSNFATRNRYYSNYQNNTMYNNSVNQYNYNTRMQRGSYR